MTINAIRALKLRTRIWFWSIIINQSCRVPRRVPDRSEWSVGNALWLSRTDLLKCIKIDRFNSQISCELVDCYTILDVTGFRGYSAMPSLFSSEPTSWVMIDLGLLGNDKAGRLAKKGTEQVPLTPLPIYGTSLNYPRTSIKLAVGNKIKFYWKNTRNLYSCSYKDPSRREAGQSYLWYSYLSTIFFPRLYVDHHRQNEHYNLG